MIIFTWCCWIFADGHRAVLPAGVAVCGVAPGLPFVVRVTAVVVVQSSGKGDDIETKIVFRKKSLSPRSSTGYRGHANPQLFLLAGVVTWCAVVFVRRLSRPVLASFPRLGHSDCTAVGFALPCEAAQLWDNGGWLRSWPKKRKTQTRKSWVQTLNLTLIL